MSGSGRVSAPRPWRLLLGAGIAVLALWLSFRGVEFSLVWRAIVGARPIPVVFAVAGVTAASALRAWRWRHIFGASGPNVGGLWRAVLIGQALNILLPAKAGEVARIEIVARQAGVERMRVAATLGIEKAYDVLTFLGLLVVVSFFLVVPAELEGAILKAVVGMTLFLAVMVAGVLLGPALADHLIVSAAPGSRPVRFLHPLADQLRLTRNWRTAGALLAWSGAIWSFAAVPNYLLLVALGLPASPVLALLVLVALQLGLSVPVGFGSIGLFEYICVLVLVPFGVAQDLALSYGLLLHLVAYLPPLALGGLYMLGRPREA